MVASATQNVLLLLSAEGRITLRSPTPVPVGSIVVLEIDAARRRAHILSVQQAPNAGVLPEPAPALLVDAPAALGNRREAIRAVATAQTTAGTVLDTGEAKITVRSVVPLPVGSIVALTIDNARRQASIVSIQPLNPDGAPHESNRAATLLELPPALLGRDTVRAVVARAAPGDTLVLQTAEGEIVVRTALRPPPGSAIELSIDPLRRNAAVLSVLPPDQAGAPPGARPVGPGPGAERLLFGWPALKDALSQLAARDPLHAAIVTDAAIARPGGRLADTILRWTEALSGGDGAAVFGPAAWAALRDGLAGDFAAGRTLASPNTEGWRGFPIPLHDGRGLGILALMVRGEPPRADGAAPQRIALQFTLRRLGEFRIEALTRYRRLEVLVRSAAALPPALAADIEAMFAEAKAAFGYGGSLQFRVGPLPLIILGPAPPEPHDVLMA